MPGPLLIVGLGNPGTTYDGTRHNIGFAVLDAFAKAHNLQLKADGKLKGELASGVIAGRRVFLLKPLTYMNRSGESVQAVVAYHKLPWSDVVVLYDDIDLPPGKIRLRKGGGAGTHNGMRSILGVSGTQELPRIRIGIGQAPPQWDLADYVLAKFTADERLLMGDTIDTCCDALDAWIRTDADAAMNRFNRQEAVEPSEASESA